MLPPLSGQEPGSLRDDFLRDALEPHPSVFFELWKGQDHLHEPIQKPYFKMLVECFPRLIEGSAFTQVGWRAGSGLLLGCEGETQIHQSKGLRHTEGRPRQKNA
jgi:hypothetical protein